jgi:Protein of unknown function (DUF3072)
MTDQLWPGGTGESQKDQSHWVTGDKPMTGQQRSYLSALAQEAGEDIRENLTMASGLFDELQRRTRWGRP